MDYTLAKLYDAQGDLKERWYIYYKVKDADGNLVSRHKKSGINKFKTAKERRSFAKIIIDQVNEMLVSGAKKGITKDDFYYWFQKRVDYSKQMHGYYNWRKLNNNLQTLKKFAPVLRVSEINNSFLRKYEVYLKTELKNSANTIADKMMRLSIIMAEIEKDGEIEYKNNPFHKIKFAKTRIVKMRFDKDQLRDFENVKLNNLQQVLARDMYLLSYYCAAIRFGDLCRLRPEMFADNRLKYEMHKSKDRKEWRNILLLKEAKSIFEKYKHNTPYLFPLNIDWDAEDKGINTCNSLMNKHLKRVCYKAVVPELTFHTSKNTFIDHAIADGTDINTIRMLVDHSKIQTTLVYAKDSYDDEKDLAMKSILKKR